MAGEGPRSAFETNAGAGHADISRGIAAPSRCAESDSAVQRHDSATLSFWAAGRDLVSGRVERRRGTALHRPDEGVDRRVAQNLGRRRFPFLFRPDRALQLWRGCRTHWGVLGSAGGGGQRNPKYGHGGDKRYRQSQGHSSRTNKKWDAGWRCWLWPALTERERLSLQARSSSEWRSKPKSFVSYSIMRKGWRAV